MKVFNNISNKENVMTLKVADTGLRVEETSSRPSEPQKKYTKTAIAVAVIGVAILAVGVLALTPVIIAIPAIAAIAMVAAGGTMMLGGGLWAAAEFRKNPAVEEENPAVEEEKPAVEEEKPAVEEEKPAVDKKVELDVTVNEDGVVVLTLFPADQEEQIKTPIKEDVVGNNREDKVYDNSPLVQLMVSAIAARIGENHSANATLTGSKVEGLTQDSLSMQIVALEKKRTEPKTVLGGLLMAAPKQSKLKPPTRDGARPSEVVQVVQGEMNVRGDEEKIVEGAD
jgi:hypothetical protein